MCGIAMVLSLAEMILACTKANNHNVSLRAVPVPLSGVWRAADASLWLQSLPLRRPHESGQRAPAAHFRLLEIRRRDRAIERGAQFLRTVERELDPRARAGLEIGVEEVERDDVAQRRVARVVIGYHALCERKPFVPALGHALGACDLDDGRAHIASYLPRCLPKKASTLLQPSIAASGRWSGACQSQMPWPGAS